MEPLYKRTQLRSVKYARMLEGETPIFTLYNVSKQTSRLPRKAAKTKKSSQT